MKFFSMKKPAIRILLLVVLLGLAIFYFRYMREGFADFREHTTDVVNQSTLDQDSSSGTFTEGSSCVKKGSGGKTVGNTTLYCCDSKWSSTAC
jgi:hypothetical protein